MIAMTRDDLSELLNQEGNGWDLDNLIHKTVDKIEGWFFPPVLKGVEYAETRRRWRMYIYNLLAFLVADADTILAAHHFAQQKSDILQVALDKSLGEDSLGCVREEV